MTDVYESKRVDLFAKTEDELKLFDREYSGVKYWELLRFTACEAVFGERVAIAGKLRRKGRVKRSLPGRCVEIVRQLCCELGAFLGAIRPPKCDVLMYSISELHDRFFRELSMPDGTRALLYATQLRRGYRGRAVPNTYLALENKLCSGRIAKDPDERAFLEELEKVLRERFGRSLTAQEMENRIIDNMRMREAYVSYYERMLRRTGCRLLLITCYYCSHAYAIEAAKNMNIPVVELQHGVVNNHIAYRFEDRDRKYTYVPDILLTFGDLHNEWVRLPKSEKSISVGYPHQEKRLRELDEVETDDRLIVVYPKLSPSFEREIDELGHRAAALGYRVAIKVHPGEVQGFELYYPLLAANRDIELIMGQDRDVYYWLKRAGFHVMASSTVGLEAMTVDNAMVFISLHTEHAQTQHLLDCGAAYGYENVSELLDMIRTAKMPDKSAIRDRLWKRDAVNNISAVISDVLGR